MGVFSRLRRDKRNGSSSTICCSKSEVGSECSSLRQDVSDSLQQHQLPTPSHALDQWSFPSSRSGLRNGSGSTNNNNRLFSRLVNHGAAFPADDTRTMGRCNSGVSSYSRMEHLASGQQHQRCSTRILNTAAACCCCSDSSTHSGASNEFCRARWCGGAYSSGVLQQQDEQQKQAVGMVLNVPTLIESRGVKCLILDAPTNENLQAYLAEMRRVGVTDLVRTCSPTYNDASVIAAGIRVHELTFPDGEAPPAEIIGKWRSLAARASAEGGVLAVHCVAGLGRGPVLVAISLIDSGFDPEEAVNFIRSRRKGALTTPF